MKEATKNEKVVFAMDGRSLRSPAKFDFREISLEAEL